MVNRVDNSNIYTNPYTANAGQRKKVDAAGVPAFLLDNDEKGVVWEREETQEKEPSATGGRSSQRESQRDSYERMEVPKEKVEKEQSAGGDSLLFENIRKFFKTIFSKVMNFVWYGNDETSDAENSDTESSEKAGTEKISSQSDKSSDNVSTEAPKNSRKGSDETLSNGIRRRSDGTYDIPEVKGKPAHSTSIITYYDRTGKLVRGDEDSRRILYNEAVGPETDAGEYGKYKKYM